MHPRTDSEWCYPRSRWMDNITQLPIVAEPSLPMRKITIWLILSFWHWNGWLQNISRSKWLYQPFLVKTDNNPLTYIITTPNFNATGHWWVRALVWFNFESEYQKGCDNTVVDVLSWVTTWLDPDMLRSILDGVALGAMHWVGSPWPHCNREWLSLRASSTCHCRLCASADSFDGLGQSPKGGLHTGSSIRLAGVQKKTDLKAFLANHASSKEGWLILWNWQNFKIHQGALYLCSMPKGKTEDLLLFVVPKAHWAATFNGCHRDTGNQGHDCTLSLLW